MYKEPTPIISTRIPLALQAVFLASCRGETVDATIGGHLPRLLFSRNWSLMINGKKVSYGMKKSVSMEGFPKGLWNEDPGTMMVMRTAADRTTEQSSDSSLLSSLQPHETTPTIRRMYSSKKTNENTRGRRKSNGKCTAPSSYEDSDTGSLVYKHGMRKSASTGTIPLMFDKVSISRSVDRTLPISSTTATTTTTTRTHLRSTCRVVSPTASSSDDNDDLPVHASEDDHDDFWMDHADDESFSVFDHSDVNHPTASVPNRWSSSLSSNISTTSFSSSASPRSVMQLLPNDAEELLYRKSVIVSTVGYYNNKNWLDEAHDDAASCLSPSCSRWDNDDDLVPKMTMNRWSSSSPSMSVHKKKIVSSCFNDSNKETGNYVVQTSIPLQQGSEIWSDSTMKHPTSPPQQPRRSIVGGCHYET